MRKKYLHDLDYFKSIIESLEEAKTVLTFLFHKKAGECMWHTYDSQACETFCDHKEVWKEIVELEDCAKCPHYQTQKENIDKINELGKVYDMLLGIDQADPFHIIKFLAIKNRKMVFSEEEGK